MIAVQEKDQHLALPVPEIIAASGGVAVPGPDVSAALAQISAPTRVLICGSLYLAGEVLKLDEAEVESSRFLKKSGAKTFFTAGSWACVGDNAHGPA